MCKLVKSSVMDVSAIIQRNFPLDNKNRDWPQICVIIFASLGGFTASAQYTWTSPSIPRLINGTESIQLSLEETSYFSIIPPIGTLLASPLVAVLMDSIGRKKMILLMTVPQIMAWILIIFSESLWVIYLSRMLNGTSDAVLFCVIPSYIGEIATPRVRGTWGNFTSIFIYFGQFLINLIGAYFNIKTTALIFLVFPILHLILFTSAPESPYYFITNNQIEKAEASLKLLRWNENVQEELNLIIKDVERQISESGTLKDVFVIPTNRKALLISITMRTCQVLSGLPAFAVYTQYIFSLAGGNLSGSTSAIIYTGILFLMASIWSFFVDGFGRRPLMIFSCIGCTVALLIEAVYFYLMLETDIKLTNFSWIPLVGMILYIITCTSGLGILPTLMLGELFSASVKGKAVSVVNVFLSLYTIFIPKLFQLLSSNFGMYVPFFVFCFCTCFSTLFSYFFMPETSRKSLEEIQQMFVKKKSDKHNIELNKY